MQQNETKKIIASQEDCDLKIICGRQLDIQRELLIPRRFLCPETIQFSVMTTKFLIS